MCGIDVHNPQVWEHSNMSLENRIHNEQVKLDANFLNNLGVVAIIALCYAPFFADLPPFWTCPDFVDG